MIIKQRNVTILEMTAKEFSELSNVFGDVAKVEESKVTKELKAGDEVEVIGNSITGRDDLIGEKAKIISISKEGDTRVICLNKFLGTYAPSSLKLIEEEPEEVLSYENVEIGELFEVTDDGSNKFPTGTIVCSINSIQNDSHSSRFQDVVSGKTEFLKYNEIKRHTPEVLSEDNVKEGEYFVITDDDTNNHSHEFAIGEIVKAKSYIDSKVFKAEHMDESDWWYAYYTGVRRATDVEIAEATKPKEVKFEIGDIVNVGGSFAKVTSEIESDGECQIKRYKDGVWGYTQASDDLRHATDEEKSHLQTLIGREKDEYEVGDLVELLSGAGSGYRGRDGYIFEVDGNSRAFIHLKDKGNKTNENDTYIHQEKLKLITPVEWRHDFI